MWCYSTPLAQRDFHLLVLFILPASSLLKAGTFGGKSALPKIVQVGEITFLITNSKRVMHLFDLFRFKNNLMYIFPNYLQCEIYYSIVFVISQDLDTLF